MKDNLNFGRKQSKCGMLAFVRDGHVGTGKQIREKAKSERNKMAEERRGVSEMNGGTNRAFRGKAKKVLE